MKETRTIMSDTNFENIYDTTGVTQYESGTPSTGTNFDVRVYPIEDPQGRTQAFAKVAVDGIAVICGIRIVEGDEGIFVAMPQSQGGDGRFHDTAFLVEPGLYEQMRDMILHEYHSPTPREAVDKSFTADMRNPADIALDASVFPNRNPRSSTKAFASVMLDDKIVIRGITIDADSKGRLAVNMPFTIDGNGTPRDVAYPILPGLRREISKAVLVAHKEIVKSRSLAENLREGKDKAAQHVPAQRTPAMARSAAAAL